MEAGEVPMDVGVVGVMNPAKMPFDLIEEEFNELQEEIPYCKAGNINDLKEAIDLIYVVCQYLNVQVGPEKAMSLFEAVHANNMDKCIDGKLVKREDGKVLKPDGFDKYAWVKSFKEILSQ
jgi:predicted HAD superfamily Cof-like phosphohydrolase